MTDASAPPMFNYNSNEPRPNSRCWDGI